MRRKFLGNALQCGIATLNIVHHISIPPMEMNRIGKFETRRIINEMDAMLIASYGVNMLDARITREQALRAFDEAGSTRQAVELCASRLGLPPQPA